MEDNTLLLYNGKFITLNPDRPIVDWIYISNGYIADMGMDDGYKKYEKEAQCLNIKGNWALPGFIDSHVHLVQSGLNILANSLNNCYSIKEILDSIKRAKAEESSFGLIIRCVGLEEIKLKESRMPTRWELDSTESERMVWISTVDYQITIVNTQAFKFLNLPFNLDGIERDGRGIPTGVLTGRANFIARKKLLGIIPDSIRKQGVDIALDNAIRQGVTTVHAMEGGFLFHDRDAELIHENMNKFPIDVELFFQTTDISKVEAMGLNRIGGSIFLDGSFQARSAALEYPYEDMEKTRGELYFSDNEIESLIFTGIQKGMDTTVHAVGSRAIGQILNVYYRAKKAFPSSKSRMRIEHFELPNLNQIELASKLNVILSMKPACEYFWGGEGKTYAKRLGKIRAKRTNPNATIIANGGIIAGGSESDLTPINPLLGIYSALNHPTKEERISNLEALKMFTINGAIAVGQEDTKGKLDLEYLADICILNTNPLEYNAERIDEIVVLGTIKAGKILFISDEIADWRDTLA
ncbi:amidohydrolase [Wukongibacter baidiensis]|uniref:amidohydrolase n=1 Tax=Wukongibacter baidiensis TaxID=1723361 RepID=UPI003D7F9503